MGVVRRGPTGLNPFCLCTVSLVFVFHRWNRCEMGARRWGAWMAMQAPVLIQSSLLQRRWGLLFILNTLLSCSVFSSPHSAPFLLLSSCPRSSSSPFGFLFLRGFSWLFLLSSSSSGLGCIVSSCFLLLYSEARKLSSLVWKQSGKPA